jgi:CO/xanthine dehydrogenase Mo-binding subunit
MKFSLGQPVRRFEDQTLITGKGRYTDDIKLEKMAQALWPASCHRTYGHDGAYCRGGRHRLHHAGE